MGLFMPYALVSMISAYALVFAALCVVNVEKDIAAAFYYMVLEAAMGLAFNVTKICFFEAVICTLVSTSAYCFKQFFCHGEAVSEYYTRAKKDIEDEALHRETYVKLHLEVGTKLLEFLQMAMEERAAAKEAGVRTQDEGVQTPSSQKEEGAQTPSSQVEEDGVKPQPSCDTSSILSAAPTE